MIEFIEPHPELIEYWQIANSKDWQLEDTTQFDIDGEWHYIQSDIEKNIFLLKSLDEMNLLPDVIRVCDCGIGLGTVMFDLYLQSKELSDKRFTFTGIEKCQTYIDFLNNNLGQFWNNNLNLISGDIMEFDYSNWNLIFFFQPYKTSTKAIRFYKKVIETVKEGTLILGLDSYNIQTYGKEDSELISKFNQLKRYKVGDWIVLQK